MVGAVSTSGSELQRSVTVDGFAFAHGDLVRDLLAPFGSTSDWPAFTDSWNRLALDTYMADGGRYRKRRYAVYTANRDGGVTRAPHQPHFQAVDYNPLNGGVDRWFEPMEPAAGDGPSLRAILGFCQSLFGTFSPATPRWHIELHQFRIEARTNEPGRPAPEGVHRDGVDYVLVLLIGRKNIASGVTTIHSLDGRPLGQFTLTDPFDAAVVDDARVAHGVTPVEPLDPAQPAYRDVLVVTFRAA